MANPANLNLAIVAPNVRPLPSYGGYGGTERSIYDICEAMANRGHSIDLFCAQGSEVNLPNTSLWEFQSSAYDNGFFEGYRGPNGQNDSLYDHSAVIFREYCDFITSSLRLIQSFRQLDIINLHLQDVDIIKSLASGTTPLVVSLHNDVDAAVLPVFEGEQDTYLTLSKTHQQRIGRGRDDVILAPAGIQGSNIPFFESSSGEEYLLYLGAVSRRKGVKTAIDISRKAGIPLIIAGPVLPWSSRHGADTTEYFREEIEPMFGDGQIRYIPTVNEVQKLELMGNATATIVASGHEDRSWQEPFGRVVAESTLTGTPVLASTYAGGASELLNHRTGALFGDIAEAAARIETLKQIDRLLCRETAQKLFSMDRYTADLEIIFNRVISKSNHSAGT